MSDAPEGLAERLVQVAGDAIESVSGADIEIEARFAVVAVLRELSREYYGRPGWNDNGDEFDVLADTLEENR
jgi:hypothetical protein